MGCGKEDSVQPSASNTEATIVKILKSPNKNSVTGFYEGGLPDGSKMTVLFDLNGNYSVNGSYSEYFTPASEVVEQGLEWEINDHKLYVLDRKLKQGEWYHCEYDIQKNGDLIINTVWDHGAVYPNGEPLRFEVPKDKQFSLIKTKLKEIKAKAEAGDSDEQLKAQLTLGSMFANGEGVLEDDNEAVKWYRKAAEQGDAPAQNNLGLMYANGTGVLEDDNEAVKWYRKAAEQGDASAQNNLGLMYANGEGVLEDDNEAVKWYRKAAEQGDASAQYNLGLMYDNGEGVLEDKKEALKWYRKAAEQGYVSAQNSLQKKFEETRAEAGKGDVIAQHNLGVMYDNGIGVLQDHNAAVKWYRKAATKKNLENAKKRFEVNFEETKAKADKGGIIAQHSLGVMYDNGIGVKENREEAKKWYRKAAEQGHADAQFLFGAMLRKGKGVLEDHKESVKWYRKAAEQGHASAQYRLGVMYDGGGVVLQDYVAAYAWINIAEANGYKTAPKFKSLLEKEMTPDQITKGETLSKEMIKKNQKLVKKRD